MNELYLDDFHVGQKFGSGRLRVETDQLRPLRPSSIHSLSTWTKRRPKARSSADWAQAEGTRLLSLCAVTSDLKPAGGVIGASNKISWTRPVRPGDELRVESEVLEVRPSKSRPEQGLIKVHSTTFNQRDEPVQVLIANLVVPARAASAPPREATTKGH